MRSSALALPSHNVDWRMVLAGLWTSMSLALLTPAMAADPVPATAGPQPLMEVKETAQDGGVVEEGTVVHFRFTVANRGEGDLLIQRVKPSCGCTVAKWEPMIKAGAEAAIEGEMNTEYFRGAVTKHLTVFSNDPNRPQLELTITARVNPLVEIKPGNAAMLAVDDKPATHEFTLERTGGKPMQIVRVVANAPYIKAESTPLPGEGRYKVTVTATTDTPAGRNVIPVTVQTDLPKGAMRMLMVTVDRGIVTVPPMVFYGILPPKLQAPMQAAISLSRHSGPFHVTEATADDPKLQVKLETVREGAEYRVTVTYPGGCGLVRKTLTIKTDDPKQQVITIPIQAVIQEPQVAGQDKPVEIRAGGTF
jgi:hypothetical protein